LKTLTYINKEISSIESQDIIFNDIKFEANSNQSLPKFLSTNESLLILREQIIIIYQYREINQFFLKEYEIKKIGRENLI
jgi:hypothetical protein